MSALDTARAYFQKTLDGGEATKEEVSEISDFIYSRFSEEEWVVVSAYRLMQDEYRVGFRCGVCGMTEKQSKAIGYDCIREC
jgi:hypothetical protein